MPRLSKATKAKKQEIGARMRSLRQQKGISQTDLAHALGLTQSNVSAIERGARGPTIDQVTRFAQVLGVRTDHVLSDETPRKDGTPKRARLLRRLERIELLPPADQRAVLKFLDALVDKHTRTDAHAQRA